MKDAVKTEEDAKQEETAAEAEETLIEETQKRLDILNGVTSSDEEDGDTDGDKQAEDDKAADDSTPDKEDDEKDDDKQAEEDDDDDDSTPEKDKDETGDKDGSKNKSDDEEITLNDAYYRAAVHQGWEPEDIKEFFEANPELAIKTFAKIHESTNKLSSEFARLGRVTPTKGQQRVEPKADDKKSDGDSDLAALKEQYGDDSAVAKMFQNMQTKLDAITKLEPEPQQQEQEEIDPIILGRIEKFWIDPAMKPYAEFYGEGKDEAKLTIGQSDNRYKVLETADSIVLGCQSQGRKITLEQAMESAHLLVSESVREGAIRKELTTKIKKRAKGVTLKPSKSKKAPEPKDKQLDEKGMLEKVAANLQRTFKT